MDGKANQKGNKKLRTNQQPLDSLSPVATLGALPLELLERIFYYLPYGVVARVRSLNSRFLQASSNYLNAAFRKLKEYIDKEAEEIKTAEIPTTAKELREFKKKRRLLPILKSEINILHEICWKYIDGNCTCLFAGQILDEFHRVMRLRLIPKETFSKRIANGSRRLFAVSDMFGAHLLRCRRVEQPRSTVLDLLNIFRWFKENYFYVSMQEELGLSYLEARFYVSDVSLRWDFHQKPTQPLSGSEEVETILRILVPFVLDSHRKLHVKDHASRNRKRRCCEYTVGDKRLWFTPKVSSCDCHKLEILVGVQSFGCPKPASEDEEPQDSSKGLDAFLDALTETFFLRLAMRNAVQHTCPSLSDCRFSNELPYEYSVFFENLNDGGESSTS